MKRFTDLVAPRSRRARGARPRRMARALPLRFTGFVESLEDRRVMATNVLASVDGAISQAGVPTELTLGVNASAQMTLGFRVHATSGSLDPAASKIQLNGVNITPTESDADLPGSKDSLTLVNLGPGEYKVLVSGTGVGNFHIDVFLPGDMNGDHQVSETESLTASAAYVQQEFGSNHVSTLIYREKGIDFSHNLYATELDTNQDGDMDSTDASLINGNAGKGTVNVTLIGDNDAPTITPSLVSDTGLSATDRITNNATVRAAIADENAIDVLTARVDGSAAVNILSKFNTSTGIATLTPADLATIAGTALGQGQHTVTFAATDRFGNASAPVAFTFTLDTVAPTAGTPDLTAATDSGVNTDNTTNFARPAFTVAAENGARVELFSSLLTGAIAQGIVSGTSITLTSGVDLSNGVHNITARVTDVAGNVTTSSLLAVTIDRTAPTTPTLTLRASDDDTAPAGDQSTSKTAVVLEGTTSANTKVQLQRSPNPFATPLETTSDASGNFTFSVNLSFGQQTFTVTASDLAGNQSTFSRAVTRNALPVLATPIADTSTAEDAAFSLNISTNFTDANTGADGDTLAYTATLQGGAALPAWLTLNASTGVFSGTPANGDVAVLNIVVTATDDVSATVSDTFQLTITNVNDAPTVATPIPNTNTNEDSPLNLSVAANFADVDTIHGDSLTFAATLEGGGALPTWLTFNTTTGTFTGTPTNSDVGAINITVTATDESAISVSDTFTLTVVNVNDAPTVATPISDQQVNEDSPFNLNVASNFADVDAGDTLTFTATLQGGGALPAWLTLSTAGAFSGTPLNADVGTITIVVTAKDSANATITDTFTLEVINVNDAPVINDQSLSIPPDSNTGAVVGTVVANDPDVGDAITYSITAGNSAGIFAINPTTGQITVALDNQLPDGSGPFLLTVQVDDGEATDSATVTINVVANNPPVVANPIPDQNATEDTPFSFTFAANTFTDADGETLTFTASLDNGNPLPSWLTFNAATRTFSGTPLNGDVGTLQIKVTATDPPQDSVSDTFSLVIANTNDAPTLVTPIADQQVNEDQAMSALNVASNFSDVDSIHGDTLTFTATLQGGGALPAWLSLSTGGVFTGTPTNADVGTITIVVTAKDSANATATDTFTLQVINVNDPPTVANLIPDQTATQFQPFNFVFAANTFADVDAGDTLTYTATLDNDQPLPAWLTFNATTRSFTGTPGASDLGDINVKVTAKDGSNATVSDTFKLTVNTGPSVQVQLVVRNTATGGTEFTFFSANPSSGSDVGIGRFQFTAGGSLTYSFSALDSVDLDGTSTPGDTTDDVIALSFRDSNGLLFNILTDNNYVKSAAAGTASGSWDAGEGLNAANLAKLYNGEIFVQIQTNSQTVKLAGKNIAPSAELTTLPTSVDSVVVGDNYIVEVWVKDLLGGSTGLSSANVDVQYSDKSTATAVVKGSPNSPFTESTSGTFDNVAHLIDNLGGGTLFAGVGLEPAFARLGYANITASGAGTENFTLAINEIFRRGSGTPINIGDIEIVNESVKHLAPVTFTVQAGAPIVVTESTSTAQSANVSDRAVLTGTISAAVDIENPTFIKFTGSNLDFTASGNWLPNSTPADFGFTRSVFGGAGTLNVALRNLIIDVTSGNIPLTPSGGNFSFSTAAQTWKTATSNGGTADGQLIVGGNPQTPTSLNISNTVLSPIGNPATSTFRNVSGNTYAIDLNIPRQFSVTISGETFTFNVSGAITAQATIAAPLTGTVVGQSATVVDGTSAFVTVSKNRTAVNSKGEITSLPKSETWLNEWDSYWAEVWVRTTDAPGVTAGSVNLAYDNRYFTATRLEHGGQFMIDTSGAIDHAAGIISNLGGTALRTDLGSGEFVLLGRVKFESLAGNQVPFDLASGTFGPYDLGLNVTSADLEIGGAAASDVVLGDSPRTELWAVPYDVNDDNRIDFGDFSVFASKFQTNVLDSDSPLAAALDFDRTGRVDMGDFSFFASNFFTSKAAHSQIVFPATFLQKWIGSGVEHDGGNTVDEVLSAAIGAWQDALGLETPIDIQLVVRDFNSNQLGSGQILSLDAAGIPDRGRVTIDDDANGLGWYTDLSQSPAGTGKYDLYTVLLHEVGHALGFTSAYGPLAAQLQTTGSGAQLVGDGFVAEFDGAGLHLSDSAHPGDVMNDSLAPGERKTLSVLDSLVLQSSYEAAAGGASLSIGSAAPLRAASSLPAAETSAVVSSPVAAANVTIVADNSLYVTPAMQSEQKLAMTFSDDLESLVLAEFQSDLDRLAVMGNSAVNRLRSQGVALVLRDARPQQADLDSIFAEFGADCESADDDYEMVAAAEDLDSLDVVLNGWDRI